MFQPFNYSNFTYEQKVNHAKDMIKSFLHLCEYEKPYISFSGGKDSVVLRHLCLSIDPNLKCECVAEMFHPEVAKYIARLGDVIIHKSKCSFEIVLQNYGLPVISKKSAQMIMQYRNAKDKTTKYYAEYIPTHLAKKWQKYLNSNLDIKITNKCCDLIKGVLKKDKRPSFVGLRNEEADRRKWEWEKHGCIRWDKKIKRCTPISIFTKTDVWRYIKENSLDYPKAYDMGWNRTGCLMCGFGTQFKRRRQELLKIKKLYPNIWNKYNKYFRPFWVLENWKELL